MYFDLKNSYEEINGFLEKHKTSLVSPEYFFGIDNGQDTPEQFTKAKYRILICFLSPGEVRGVSNTFMALNGIIKAELGNDVFVDYAYTPAPDDQGVMIKEKIPFWFGNVSHHPVKDYDLMLISHSIVPESFNLARDLYYTGIPLGRENRFKDNTVPFIIYGGAASIVSSNILGEIPQEYGGGHSMVDACDYGFGEDRLNHIVRFLLEHGIGKKENKEVILDEGTHEFPYLADPLAYEFVMSEEHPFRIKAINKKKAWMKDKVAIGNTYDVNYPGFSHKVFNLDGQNADSTDVMLSLGCSGQGSCSFCSEGTVAGPFREKPFDKIKEDIHKTKQMSAANSCGFYAYNLNYYSHIFELLGEAGRDFSSISLINMRVDEIANNPDFLTLAKALGQIRSSCAIEGMGERVRNHVLNKNLSKETLYVAVKAVMEQKFIMAKFGMIRTGWETRADQDEFLEEIEHILQIRSELGANTALQFSFTPLVVYDNIPLRYEPRITAKESLEDARNMSYFLDKVHDLGVKYNAYIRCKFNGRGPGTFIEQMLLDGGRTLTRVLVRMSLDDGMDYQRNFGDSHKQSLLKWCNYYKLDYQDIFRERDNDEIFWSDWIQFVVPKRLQEWHDMHLKHDYAHGYCLKTNSSSGHCYGCGTCPDGTAIKSITQRELSHIPVEDVIATLAGKRVRSVTRVVFEKSSEWRIYNNETLAHYVTSQFLQLKPELIDAFHMIAKHNTFWLGQNEQKDWYSGYAVFDIEWKDIVRASELQPLIEQVNSKLHIGRIKAIYDIDQTQEMNTKCEMSYVFKMDDVSLGRITERFNNFDWQVKTIEKGPSGMAEVVKKYMPNLKGRMLFIPHQSDVLAFMSLPVTVSPVMVMSSLLGVPTEACLKYDYRIVDVGAPSDIVCKRDGNTADFDIVNNKQVSECPVCRGKKILYILSKKN